MNDDNLLGLEITDEFNLKLMERKFADCALDLIGQGERHWKKKAAMNAGYAESGAATSAYELIRRPHVVGYMMARMTEAAETLKVDRSFVLFRAVTNMTACEAQGDYRTAYRYLDMVAKHVMVGAYLPQSPEQPGGGDNLPFDPDAYTEDEALLLIRLLKKGARGKPADQSTD